MNSNPVTEVFGELFEKLKDRSAKEAAREAELAAAVEKAQPKDPFGLNPLFSGAIGQYQGVTVHAPWVVKKTVFSSSVGDVIEFTEEAGKAAGDTIHYDLQRQVNSMTTEELNKEFPPDWSFTVPQAPPPVKRFRKRTKK